MFNSLTRSFRSFWVPDRRYLGPMRTGGVRRSLSKRSFKAATTGNSDLTRSVAAAQAAPGQPMLVIGSI